MATSRYEIDIQEQPRALRAFAATVLPRGLSDLNIERYDRIILTGMGSSHFAAHRVWCSLVSEGHDAWWVSTAQLLEAQELITADSLLWVTSQSGESGEVVALLDACEGAKRPRTLLATTNELTSRLAVAADLVVALESGEEGAVSTKTYVATLAANDRILGSLHHADDSPIVNEILVAADELERFDPRLGTVASAALQDQQPRFVLVANSASACSALFGALMLNETAKLPAEAFLGGEFRHGPIELAGSGLTAVLFGSGTMNPSLTGLGEDLTSTGSRVVHVDPGPVSVGWLSISTNATGSLGRAICGAKFCQLLSVELARGRGLEPGVFRFGSKVTTSL